MPKPVYLDYAATTPLDPAVLEAMTPYFLTDFGNPASLHSIGQSAQTALDLARRDLALSINSSPKEIIFTSSATESNNLAIKGLALAHSKKHLIVSSIEHDCVLGAARWLEKQGYSVEYLPVDSLGQVSLSDLEKMITPDTLLVSVMHANNEIGTIQPISQIGKLCRSKNVLFHVDSAQTLGKIPLDVKAMNIDLLSASSHKIYGPKGVALLYVRQGIKLEPLLSGGGQENGLRSSTVNVAGIVGFAKAVNIALGDIASESASITTLRDRLIDGVLSTIPRSYLTGHPVNRLYNHASFRFDLIEGESIIIGLDQSGIAASTASACSSPKLEPSHVLLALGLSHQQAHGSLRLTLGRWTTGSDIDYVLKVLPQVVNNLRILSPFK